MHLIVLLVRHGKTLPLPPKMVEDLKAATAVLPWEAAGEATGAQGVRRPGQRWRDQDGGVRQATRTKERVAVDQGAPR